MTCIITAAKVKTQYRCVFGEPNLPLFFFVFYEVATSTKQTSEEVDNFSVRVHTVWWIFFWIMLVRRYTLYIGEIFLHRYSLSYWLVSTDKRYTVQLFHAGTC